MKMSQEMKTARLEAEDGLSVDLLNYGGIIQSLRVPCGLGGLNVVLGYEDPADYLQDPFYLGCALGRYAGRIDSGRFRLGETEYQLECNDAQHGHSLHSGASGFSKAFWNVASQDAVSVAYEHFSPDGEGGFPGNLDCRVTYSLASPMALQVDFSAVSDADTVLNLSNHSYFNLSGGGSKVEDHEVWLNSDLFLPMAPNMLPSGDVRSVNGTEFDFRQVKSIEEGLRAGGAQVELAGGIDHYFLLNRTHSFPWLSASVKSPTSGIRMKLYTSQPGVQFYTGNFLSDPFLHREGLCLEFQAAPNAPNHPGFPSAFLRAGERYRHQIIYEFEACTQ